jgi:hypothetical protein
MADLLSLPRALGDGLVLRWAAAEDADELADFNFRHHNDNPSGRPEEWLKEWTYDLMDGSHPTTGSNDVTVVVDEKNGGKIVSTVFLISQTWSYGGIPFGCGMPELIATEAEYRRQGLIRLQMDVIHALSEQKGQLVQGIGGIPWYYRQFGYEMALDMGGGFQLPFASLKPLPEGESEPYCLRPVMSADLPLLKELYALTCESSLVACVRDDPVWRYEIEKSGERPVPMRHLEIIETAGGEAVGYIQIPTFPVPNRIRELALRPGHSLRAFCHFLGRNGRARVEASDIENPPTTFLFNLGETHPAYEAVGDQAGSRRPLYAWYVRVPDLARFLNHIRPVLDERVAGSVMAGHSGVLKLSFYSSQLKVVLEKGRVAAVESYETEDFFVTDVFFPDLTFLHQLFGHRSLEELRHTRADCYSQNDEASLLLKILFPRQRSHLIPLT